MTVTTMKQEHPADKQARTDFSKRIGISLVAQAEFLREISIASPTGMSGAVTLEMANHLAQVGHFLANGFADAVIHDIDTAFTAATASMGALLIAVEHSGKNIGDFDACVDGFNETLEAFVDATLKQGLAPAASIVDALT